MELKQLYRALFRDANLSKRRSPRARLKLPAGRGAAPCSISWSPPPEAFAPHGRCRPHRLMSFDWQGRFYSRMPSLPMRFVPSSFQCLCAGAALAASAGACGGPGGRRSPSRSSIEFSAPRNDTLVTNVDQLDQETRDSRDIEAVSSRSKAFSTPGGGLATPCPGRRPSAGMVVQQAVEEPFRTGGRFPVPCARGIAEEDVDPGPSEIALR